LDDLKSDINRKSDRHDTGMRKLFELHEEHTKDDTRHFDAIDLQFQNAAILAAEAKGAAVSRAKFWRLTLGLPTPVLAGIWACMKYVLHIIKQC
jgi:hypothetical protein